MTTRNAEDGDSGPAKRVKADVRLQEFFGWLEKHGAKWPKLVFEDIEGYGLGAVAREPIEADELFASIPNDLIFAESSVLRTPIATAILSSTKLSAMPPLHYGARLTPRHILYTVMILQRHDPTSLWGPYFRLIPDTFSTAVWYSAEEMELLVGTNLYGAIVQRKDALYEVYCDLFPALSNEYPDLFPADVCTFEAFRWAESAFLSRCFPARLLPGQVQTPLPRCFARTEADACLLPMLDLLNHKPHTSITWLTSNESLSFVAGRRVEAGEQVFNNYGPRSNEELALLYGFALPDNEHDYVRVAVSTLRDVYDGVPVSDLFRQCGESSQHILTRADPLPESLMRAVRLSVVQKAAIIATPAPLWTRATLDALAENMELELCALDALDGLLCAKLALIRGSDAADQARVAAADCPATTRAALLYRCGLRTILRKAILTGRTRRLALPPPPPSRQLPPLQLSSTAGGVADVTPTMQVNTLGDGVVSKVDAPPGFVFWSLSADQVLSFDSVGRRKKQFHSVIGGYARRNDIGEEEKLVIAVLVDMADASSKFAPFYSAVKRAGLLADGLWKSEWLEDTEFSRLIPEAINDSTDYRYEDVMEEVMRKHPSHVPKAACTLDKYRWASALVTARACELPSSTSEPFMCLLPLPGGNFRHSTHPNVRIFYDAAAGSVTVVAATPVRAGEELTISLLSGATNGQLLRRGQCLPFAPMNEVVPLLEKVDTKWLHSDFKTCGLLSGGRIPPGLLNVALLTTLPPDEQAAMKEKCSLRVKQMVYSSQAGGDLSIVQPLDVATTEQRIAAYKFLLSSMEEKITVFGNSLAELQQQAPENALRLLRCYASAQQRAIAEGIDAVKAALAALTPPSQ